MTTISAVVVPFEKRPTTAFIHGLHGTGFTLSTYLCPLHFVMTLFGLKPYTIKSAKYKESPWCDCCCCLTNKLWFSTFLSMIWLLGYTLVMIVLVGASISYLIEVGKVDLLDRDTVALTQICLSAICTWFNLLHGLWYRRSHAQLATMLDRYKVADNGHL